MRAERTDREQIARHRQQDRRHTIGEGNHAAAADSVEQPAEQQRPEEIAGRERLLRGLQEGHFERVGDKRTRNVDVRLIAATNRDLKQDVQRGRFREDLYFRLNVFPIHSVPLRERREDIPLLARHFLASERSDKGNMLRLSEGDVRKLMRYDWPGNVRELQNVIERATILAQNGRLRFDPPDSPGPAQLTAGSSHQMPEPRPAVLTAAELRNLERQNIAAALRACGGKIFGNDGAAAMLEMTPTTLASRIKALGIGAGP
ncbi:MAG: sigma 54-interacting transcriptional regulator [Rhodopseudomonas palustris]|uniref:Sigma 54-interacting transcriptional regulator n=1 Tax=Rhodopseudomonas palustris TaxID=1076 RepID=A0A933VVR7_RHOPL|nr:sigma 54-interacting transcriptional regulator [Rhodopseudomonas palustris]